MKGKYIPFLILPIFLFTIFLFNPFIVRGQQPVDTSEEEEQNDGEDTEVIVEEEEVYLEGWVDSSTCEAVDCGTTKGTKTQTLYAKVCEQTCPKIPFEATSQKLIREGYYYCEDRSQSVKKGQTEYVCTRTETRYAKPTRQGCPKKGSAYTYSSKPNKRGMTCKRNIEVEIPAKYKDPVYKNLYFSKEVQYLMREKEGKCVRPYVKWVINWKNKWARSQYNENMPLWVDTIDTNTCESVATDVREVDCEAELIPCDEEEVLGTEDKVEVVLAETSSTNNSLVYIVQAILALSSLASAIYFAKKYIF